MSAMSLPAPTAFVSRRGLPLHGQNVIPAAQILDAGTSSSFLQHQVSRLEIPSCARSSNLSATKDERTLSDSPRAQYDRRAVNAVQHESNLRSLMSHSVQLSLEDLEWMLIETDVTAEHITKFIRDQFVEQILLVDSRCPEPGLLKIPDQNEF